MLCHGQQNLAHTFDIWNNIRTRDAAVSRACQSAFMRAYHNNVKGPSVKTMSYNACATAWYFHVIHLCREWSEGKRLFDDLRSRSESGKMCDFPRVFTRREACTYYNPFPNAPAPKSWNYCIAAHPAFVQKRKYAVLSERLVHVPLKILSLIHI